ncbi:hypothetical protein LINGRAHAP2_LOCUS2853, partial [Linum grandiflorum]
MENLIPIYFFPNLQNSVHPLLSYPCAPRPPLVLRSKINIANNNQTELHYFGSSPSFNTNRDQQPRSSNSPTQGKYNL